MSLSRYSALISAALLAACAATTPQPDGRWKSAGDNEPPIELELKNGRLSVSGGCNRLFGTARVENGVLIVDQLASTMMACDAVSMARDRDLSLLLNSRPTVRQQDGHLLLAGPGKQLELRQQEDLSAAPTRLVYVAAERKPCSGVAPMQCLQVRDSKDAPWQLHYGEIEGFKPEPGIAYRLRIREVKVARPPADAPSVRWVLDQVLEQKLEQQVVAP
jgi:heat shock protein HslJ